jgi:hypothetical protein
MKESVSAIRGRRNDVLRRLASVFMIAVPVNYLWELGQSPLYLPPSRLGDMLWHCFVASLGDGVIIGLIYAACAILFRDRNWFGRMSVAHWGALLTVNLAVGTLVEWAGLRLHRWSYADAMPLVPGVGVGLVPILQMLVLPPLVFWVCRMRASRRPRRRR